MIEEEANSNNISFFLNELDKSESDSMFEFCQSVYIENDLFNNIDDEYENYTIKELLKICEYYDIDKSVRASKCKKTDIVATILYYEQIPENIYIVNRRQKLWSYMRELSNDTKMKKYIIWK